MFEEVNLEVTLQTCILEVAVLNLGLTEAVPGPPKSVQANTGTLSLLGKE